MRKTDKGLALWELTAQGAQQQECIAVCTCLFSPVPTALLLWVPLADRETALLAPRQIAAGDTDRKRA